MLPSCAATTTWASPTKLKPATSVSVPSRRSCKRQRSTAVSCWRKRKGLVGRRTCVAFCSGMLEHRERRCAPIRVHHATCTTTPTPPTLTVFLTAAPRTGIAPTRLKVRISINQRQHHHTTRTQKHRNLRQCLSTVLTQSTVDLSYGSCLVPWPPPSSYCCTGSIQDQRGSVALCYCIFAQLRNHTTTNEGVDALYKYIVVHPDCAEFVAQFNKCSDAFRSFLKRRLEKAAAEDPNKPANFVFPEVVLRTS